jgi:hypothetical protein
MLKYLRIAVTALCLTACVLLSVLWVRSYWWMDYADIPSGQQLIRLASIPGHVWWDVIDGPGVWQLGTTSVEAHIRAGKRLGHGSQLATGFRFESSAGRVPYWFLVILTAAVAAVPWIKWRFSLRTLLIAMTLVAIGLGAVIYLAR